MEEFYQNTIILITARPAAKKLRWRATCKVKFMKGGREVVRTLELSLDYDTVAQAERAILVFAKLWIDAGQPNLPKP